jgi:F0F1-type ATP synthase membrane subunit b/b'
LSVRPPRSREKQRAVAELRGEVTDLACCRRRVVGDAMTADRQRKLVSDFLAESRGGSNN